MPTPARCDALPESLRPSGKVQLFPMPALRDVTLNATFPLRATRRSRPELRTCRLCFNTLSIQILALVALEYGIVGLRLVDFVFGCVHVGQIFQYLSGTTAHRLLEAFSFRDSISAKQKR